MSLTESDVVALTEIALVSMSNYKLGSGLEAVPFRKMVHLAVLSEEVRGSLDTRAELLEVEPECVGELIVGEGVTVWNFECSRPIEVCTEAKT